MFLMVLENEEKVSGRMNSLKHPHPKEWTLERKDTQVLSDLGCQVTSPGLSPEETAERQCSQLSYVSAEKQVLFGLQFDGTI